MTTTERQLVTIVAESVLRRRLLDDLRQLGATGYSISSTDGSGTGGRNTSDWEGPHIRIETIVRDDVAEAILAHLVEHYFSNYAVVAWASTVRVARPAKFD
jgi:nitrogen regulatory protein P-II 2